MATTVPIVVEPDAARKIQALVDDLERRMAEIRALRAERDELRADLVAVREIVALPGLLAEHRLRCLEGFLASVEVEI